MHQLPQGPHLGLDAGGEPELHQGTLQIVLGVLGLEIHVAVEVVGEKPEPQLKSDQLSRIGQQPQLRCAQQWCRLRQVALENRLSQG